MQVKQIITQCLAPAIGAAGLPTDLLDAALEDTKAILDELREAHRAGMRHLVLPFQRDDLDALRAVAEAIRQDCDDVVICGTGGSSLGGQTLAQVAGWNTPIAATFNRQTPRLHFLDNIDAASFDRAIAGLDLARSRFVFISKSGGTSETLAQALLAVQACEAAGLRNEIARRMVALTEPGASPLRRLAEARGMTILPHLTDLGGRFSVLSNVGLLPAILAGLDPAAVREGAARAVSALLNGAGPDDVPAAVGAALNVAFARHRQANIAVLMAYCDRLERFTRWHAQLWAESLGKQGLGTTPFAALGPVDQHSQLQLYLAGPRDKLFTVITTDTAGAGTAIAPALAQEAGAEGLSGKSLGDLVASMQQATIDTLAANGRPVRTLHVESNNGDTLDAGSIGELLMHFMLETMIAARLFKVDAFDQPAVEEGKQLARRYLAQL